MKVSFSKLALISCLSVTGTAQSFAAPTGVQHASTPIVIDGVANESAWDKAQWHPLDQLMVGDMPTPADFSGRFKMLWDNDQLYLQVEIVDDVLIDTHPNPLRAYWDDDCLEIFIDADASGGDHLNNYNAFAYHIALDGNVVDIGPADNGAQEFVLLNEHATSRWTRADSTPYTMTWEVSFRVYPDTFHHNNPVAPLQLSADQVLGFMLAYCDNDGSEEREHFLGSHAITPVDGDKNRGFIDASVFGQIKLLK
ncbi:MAG: CBM9 family sugar-binding protein [Alteromonadaceae bacterium]|nr:CBM9 family sugar-binding protein [Alteromonadaceae bacterium]